MNTKDKELLCSLIRDHEDSVGSSRVAMMAIKAFIESIKRLRCKADEMRAFCSELCDALKDTQPKIIPLIHLMEEFEREIRNAPESGTEEIKAYAIKILEEKHAKIKTKVGQVIGQGLDCIDEGDVFIIHTLSLDITNMLKLASEVFQKPFKVILLRQDPTKTGRLVKELSGAGIDMEVIPEYDLVHYIEQANKMLMGAVSITKDMKAVSAVGTANVVSLCHLNGLKVYLFANTLKFAHGLSSQQHIHRKVESKKDGGVCYQLTTHSHDMVDLHYVDFLMTENGLMNKHAIAEMIKAAQQNSPFQTFAA